LRLYGRGAVHLAGTPAYDALVTHFAPRAGARAIVTVELERIVTSCGYSVPRYDFVDDRDQLDKWTANKGDDGLETYRREKNARSIDGLPGL
jgi:hypothetical protein